MKKLSVLLLLFVLIHPLPPQINTYGRNERKKATAQKPVSLPRSSPEQQGISSADLLSFVDAADKEIDTMNSLIVVRHGQVIAEGWWSPYDRDTPHILYSLSKSFTSTAVGLAISEGKLSLDDQILKFFPEEAPPEPSVNLRAMRVRDLLRMSSGNQTEAPIRVGDPAGGNDTWTKIFLAHQVPFKPGTHFLYNSPATYMLSAIVQKVTGMTVLDYLKPRLFDPLGFKDPHWISSPQGISAGAYGLSARTEEIANFGVLYLQKGMWNGKQLIPASWVEQATAMQTANGSAPTSDWDQGYGFQFWRSRHNSFRGDGAFGQYCMVIPELDAVVAMTSGVRDMQKVMNLVWDKLLPAMKDKRLPENTSVRKQLESRLAGLTVKFPSGKSSSQMASRISGKWFELPENERGLKAVSLDFSSASPSLLVQTAAGETRTPLAFNLWSKSKGSFANGLDKFLSVPQNPLIAASGAWSAEDTYTVKLILYETPFYSTINFRFEGDRVLIDTEHNVAFGPTKLPQLTGHLRS
jgi:CubicO group peptidase (beta-lactamase class C family)